MFYCLFLICVSTISCLAYENLALNKPAWQQYPYYATKWGANNAVDGRYDDRTAGGDQCTISANEAQTATWRVDLERVSSISHINFMYRTDNLPHPSPYVPRLAGFFLYVSNTSSQNNGHLCFHEIQTVNGTPSENQMINCPVHGRYVIFYNERKSGVTYPSYYSKYAFNELCELQVFGCVHPGFYGENCSLYCPNKCENHTCHIYSGECYGCVQGYKGPRCSQQCDDGKYGAQCSLSCGNCREGEPCHHVNGTCLNGCREGFKGITCMDECQEGYYGENCTERCSKNCVNDKKCNRFNGECTGGCEPGWKPPNCNFGCDGKSFGQNCSRRCGHCLDNKHCHHINGSCLNGCLSGYHGSLCLDISDLCPCAAESTKIYTSIIISSVVTVTIVLVSGIINYLIWRKNQSCAREERHGKLICQTSDTYVQDQCNSKDNRVTSNYAEIGTIDKIAYNYEELHHYANPVENI